MHDQEQDERVCHARQTDMQNLLPTVCAVDLRRLVKHLIDAHERGIEDDALPADALPEAGYNADRNKILRNRHETDGLGADHLCNLGQRAVIRGADRIDHGHQNDRGNKVRQIGYRLHRFHKPPAAQLLESERENQRRREKQHQRGKVKLERITDIGQKVRIGEQTLKPLKTHEFRIEAPKQLIIIECAA